MIPMRTSRTLATVGAAALLAALLGGCSATIIDRSDSGAGSTPAPAQATPSETAETKTPAPADDEAAPDSSGLSPENAADRERMIAMATTTMTCPAGALTEDGAIVRVEGACGDLVIEIDAGVVIVDDVQNVTLSGSGTVVYAGTVDNLMVTGSASTVYWTGETPTIDDRGSANTLRRG